MLESDPSAGVVTTDLSADLDLSTLPRGYCRAILVAVAGNLALLTRDEEDVVIPVPAGVIPVGAITIKSAANGTTATGVTAIK